MSTFITSQTLPVPNIVNRNAAGEREDLLSTPSVSRVYKNGVLQVGEAAVVTKVIGETGEYAVSYTPTGTASGDDWYVAADITRADSSTDTVSSPVCRVENAEVSSLTFGRPLAVYGSTSASDALRAAKNERVNIIGIGDSNWLKDLTGYDHGLQKALNDRFGLFATGMASAAPNNFNGISEGYGWSTVNAGSGKDDWTSTGADAFFDKYMDFNGGSWLPLDYAWLPAGGTSNGNNGIAVSASVFDLSEAWTYEYQYGVFASGAGVRRAVLRRGGSPYSTVVGPAEFVPAGPSDTLAWDVLSAPADSARASWSTLQGMYQRGGTTSAGKNVTYYQRMIRTAATSGVSLSSMYGVGGNSLRDMANDMQLADNAVLENYFAGVMKNGDGKCIIVVNSGLNDRNEGSVSVGPGAVADGDSAEAYADNFVAIKEECEARWVAAGLDVTNLSWVLVPSHVISDPRDAELDAYRQVAVTDLSQLDRVSVVDLASGTTESEMQPFYLAPGSDQNHLNQAGYERVGEMLIDAVTGFASSVSGSCVSPETVAEAVRSELAVEMARIDVPSSTRGISDLTQQDVIDAFDNSQTSGDVNALTSVLGTPAGASLAADIAGVVAGVTASEGDAGKYLTRVTDNGDGTKWLTYWDRAADPDTDAALFRIRFNAAGEHLAVEVTP